MVIEVAYFTLGRFAPMYVGGRDLTVDVDGRDV